MCWFEPSEQVQKRKMRVKQRKKEQDLERLNKLVFSIAPPEMEARIEERIAQEIWVGRK